MKRIKELFKSVSSKNGSYSMAMITIVICIVIVVNLLVAKLPEKVRNIDISDNKIYEISDTSKSILKKLDKKITFTVYAEKSSADDRIKNFVAKYADLSDKIQVKWVDPVLHPSELTENNVEADNILIRCADTGKSTVVTFDEIIVQDEYSYYMTGSATETEFDGEGQLTGAVNYVTSDAAKTIYYTTGHGEQTFSASVSDLLDKNNMTETELNLMMQTEIPEDCSLLIMDGPTKDITEDEKNMLTSYMESGGKVVVLLTQMDGEAPNLDAFLAEYGMERVDGYIADMQRCYQGNYYYIFPEITASGDLADGLSSNMVLLANSHGMSVIDPERDTITVTPFMSTSSDAYAVTEEAQNQGTYTLGAYATESVSEDNAEDEDTESSEKESRLTVLTSESLIDSQITDAFGTLENLDLFMNVISSNFDDVENVAIEAKSLETTTNTMAHAGFISLLVIFGIPLFILGFGFVKWWKRRKA